MAWTGEGTGAPSGTREGEDWGLTCRLDKSGPPLYCMPWAQRPGNRETFHSSLFMGLQGAALPWKCTYKIGAITQGADFL